MGCAAVDSEKCLILTGFFPLNLHHSPCTFLSFFLFLGREVVTRAEMSCSAVDLGVTTWRHNLVFKVAPEASSTSVVSRCLGIFGPTADLLHATGQLHLVGSVQPVESADAGAYEDFIRGVRAIGIHGLPEPFADGIEPDVFLL